MLTFKKEHENWLKKKLQIDLEYFKRQIPIVLKTYILGTFASIIIVYFATRFFTPEEYGKYRFVFNILGIFGVLQLPKMVSAISQSLATNATSALWYTLKLYVPFALITSLLTLLCIPFLFLFNRFELWPYFILAALFLPLQYIGVTFYGSIIQGKSLFKNELKINISLKIIVLPLGLIAIFYSHSPLLLFFANFCIPAAIYFLATLYFLPKFSNNTKDASIFKYGFKLSLITIPVNIVWYIDGLLIPAFFGLEELAIFAIVMLIPVESKQIFKQLLVTSLSRQAIGEDTKKRRKHLFKLIVYATTGMAVICLLYVYFAPFILYYVFPQYNTSSTLFLLRLAIILLLFEPVTLVQQYLEAQKNLKALQWSQYFSAIVFCAMMPFLIPQFGIIGAIIARIVYRMCYMGSMLYFLFAKRYQVA